MMYQTVLKFRLVLIGELLGIEHAREVRDLLGGDYYVDYGFDDNGPDGKVVRLGDIIPTTTKPQ